MNIKDCLNELRNDLTKYFITNNENEWIDVNVININRIDIKIVSEKANDEDMVRKVIYEAIESANSKIDDDRINFYIGHLNFHTIEEAEFLGISKPVRRSKEIVSFGNAVDLRNNNELIEDKNKENINNSRIISFYSYKGGVGRTVALIQTAYLLAKEGKKVLLVDLDIEAPSFYNIFGDQIKQDLGIVDYLYEKLYTDNPISLRDIISKLNLNLKGEMYLIPAGISNLRYVKRLDMLKEKRIYENKYIQKIIKEAEEEYGIEYTLIDTRTGINRWGAISIIDISNEVMLFGYPNKENINGLKLILDIIDDYKKATTILSRIPDTKEGRNVARKLFNELSTRQEYIPIYYNENIALADRYPVEKLTEPYKIISDFILEEERNIKINKYIKHNLEIAEDILYSINKVKFDTMIIGREHKINEKNNWIIIKLKEDRLNLEDLFWLQYDSFPYEVKEELLDDIDIPTEFVDSRDAKEIKEEVILYLVNGSNKESVTKLLFAYVLKIINESIYDRRFEAVGIENLRESSYEQYIEYITNENLENIKDITEVHLDLEEDYTIVYQTINCVLYADNILELFGDEYECKIILDNILRIIKYINTKTSIRLKLILNNKLYEINSQSIDEYNANVLNLVWSNIIKSNVIDDINEIFRESIDFMDDKIIKLIYNELIKERSDNPKIVRNNDNTLDLNIFEELIVYSSENKNTLHNIIYGKRINPNIYSKLLSDWIYEKLKEKNALSKSSVYKLISNASQIELSNITNNLNDKKSSILSFSSFKEAMEKI